MKVFLFIFLAILWMVVCDMGGLGTAMFYLGEIAIGFFVYQKEIKQGHW